MQFLIGFTGLIATMNLALLPQTVAQVTQNNFQGRGVSQGAAFANGRNADVSLIIDRDNFGLEMAEPSAVRGEPAGTRARVQYRGAIIRRNNRSTNASSFTLDGRVRSFNSSANLRAINNTTGTCRIEVFDSRIISSTCNTVAPDSSTRFLGLEQF